MPIEKSDLYSSLWSRCDEPPGQYKDYVLVLLFIKYISNKYSGVPMRRHHTQWLDFYGHGALKGKPTTPHISTGRFSMRINKCLTRIIIIDLQQIL